MQEIAAAVVTPAESIENIINNIKSSNTRGLKEIHQNSFWRYKMPIAIVGGGPSLANHLDELRRFNNIMVCGSAHDYLVDNKIYPNWCAVCDPDEIMGRYITKAGAPTHYLLASQCHPSLFEQLKDQSVYIWHAGGEHFDNANFGENKIIVGGGCTIGTRAIVLALNFGFENIHLFGFDSCLDNNYKHHAYDFVDPANESVGNIMEIKFSETSPTYKVAGYMLGQIFDFKNLLRQYASRIDVTVHGDGPLAYIIKTSKEKAKEQL